MLLHELLFTMKAQLESLQFESRRQKTEIKFTVSED